MFMAYILAALTDFQLSHAFPCDILKPVKGLCK
uniref:Uncharacterized protein n=1 Tax=Anguilla anguilla TaxID=7936 RepID=A0A0E9U9H4_ANGAN